MTARIAFAAFDADAFRRARQAEAALADEMFEVAIATREADFLALMREGACHVAVLDGSGRDPSRSLSLAPLIRGLCPVLALTAEAAPLQRLQALDAGADEVLSLDPSGPLDGFTLILRLRSLAQGAALLARHAHGLALRGEQGLAPRKHGRVLVLDPNAASGERLASLLKREEHEAEALVSPDVALQQAAEGTYQVALVAFAWPDRDGLKLCRQLRLVDRSGGLRTLLLAEKADPGLYFAAASGVDDVLYRPFDRCEIAARVAWAALKSQIALALEASECRFLAPPVVPLPAFRRRPPERFAA